MIYISAVGMINALGNNLDEIATNLTRGVAPGMRPRAGWLQGHPQAVLAGARRPGLYPFNRLLFQRQSDNQRAQAYRSGAGRCRHCGWRRHPEPDAD